MRSNGVIICKKWSRRSNLIDCIQQKIKNILYDDNNLEVNEIKDKLEKQEVEINSR